MFSNLEKGLPQGTSPLVWFHAASLGEFEQGRPIIEALKEQHPDARILLTFFSPSGFEVRKGYAVADYICYLPVETAGNVRRFFDITKPDIAIFIKYEFWKGYIDEAKRRGIRLLSVSAIFRENQVFFKSYGQLFRESLRHFDHFFVQNEKSKTLLSTIGIEAVTVSGDTRFDRVAMVKSQTKQIELAHSFKQNELVAVLGSVWPSDMQALYPAIEALGGQMKFIIAPHQIDPSFLQKMEMKCGHSSIRFSKATPDNVTDKRILLIDNIGMLSSLYGYGEMAFVGGGFRGALHNTLEPAAFAIPVLWGDHKKNIKFQEASGLIEAGGGTALHSPEDATRVFTNLVNKEDLRKKQGEAAGKFVESNKGATRQIMAYIDQLLKKNEG